MAGDLVSFEDNVKSRVKSIVAELIPEERWEAIVKITIQDFEKTDLPKLIKGELIEKYKKLIIAELDKIEWQGNYKDGYAGASDNIKKIIIESAPMILAEMIGGVTQNILQSYRNQMQNYRPY